MRKSLDKVTITPDMRDRQIKLRKFLRDNKVTHKELRPIGFSIDTRTIPENKVEEFLVIAHSVKHDKTDKQNVKKNN